MTNDNTPRESINGLQRRTTMRAKCLSLLAAGIPVKDISGQLRCSIKTIYKLLKEPEFMALLEQERELISVDAISASGAIVGSAIAQVQKAINEGDARLAFEFLKETGVLRTTGGKLGMDAKNAKESVQGLQVIINVSSDQFPTSGVVKEAECVESDHNSMDDSNSN